MKPRKKIEKKVLAMSKRLHDIPEDCKQYAFALFPKTAKYQKGVKNRYMGKVWCQQCGHTENVSEPELAVSLHLTHLCSQCGAEMSMEHDPHMRENYEERHVACFQTYKGWEVARAFKATRYNILGQDTRYIIHELFQIWISEEGEEVICGLRYTRSPFNTSWDYNSEFDIKFHNASYSSSYAFEDMFDITNFYIYPRIHATKRLYRNGWTKKILKGNRNVDIAALMKALLTRSDIETLAKQGQYEVLKYMIDGNHQTVSFPHSLRICHRNHYIIKDAAIWFDYLETLEDLGLDTHNAYYVCPKDLNEAHDRAIKKLRAQREREEKLQQYKEARKYEKKYQSLKGKYLSIRFTDGQIDVAVLQSVIDFLEEGKAMHHCVYERKYFLKENALILSARKDGERLETIEVNLETFKVVQSRAVCNGRSQFHDQIINLVNKNMNLIRQAV